MGLIERLSWVSEPNVNCRPEDRQKSVEAQREMRNKMSRIQLFPGSLEEYERKTGEQVEIIDLSGEKQFLEGKYFRWREIDFGDEGRSGRLRDFLNTKKWNRITVGLPETYSELLLRSVELGVDAIIHYREGGGDFADSFSQSGVPVRRIHSREEVELTPEVPSNL